MQRLKRIAPTFVIAVGILAGTALTVFARQSPWLWLLPAGPLLLSLSILMARYLDRRWTSGDKGSWKSAVSMSIACFVSALVVAYVSPKWIAEVVALFGASSFAVLSEPLRCFSARKPNASAA